MKKAFTWLVVFSALASTSAYALQPQSGARTVLAAAKENNESALIMNVEDKQEENTLRRIANRVNKKNLICTIDSEQAAYLSAKYETGTETIEVDGEDVSVFKIEKEPANNREIREYLNETGEDNCIIIPARSWYYVVLGGHIS